MSRSDPRRSSGSVYWAEYGTGDAGGAAIGVEIARGVAIVRGEDPSAPGFVLADYVDPDALDALAGSRGADWRFDLDVPDCHVTVRGDGTLVVRPSQGPTTDA
jgi:hypothetical protein